MSVPSWRSIVSVSTFVVSILVARLPSAISKSTSESRSFVPPWIGPWVSYAGSINRTPKSCGSLTASPVLAQRRIAHRVNAPPNKALQLTWHSAFQSRSGSILATTMGASATVSGLCHAAERPVR